MTHNFCTLFDKNYLYRGLALYNSLLKHCASFKLWILCMDATTYTTLKKLKLEKARLISLAEFEDKDLLSIKDSRTSEEYCWTCTPSLVSFVIKKIPSMEIVSYLDADLYFFSSPEPIFKEIGSGSIMIIPHRFPPDKKEYEQTKGIYNVSMVSFRNDDNGLKCLNWWRKKCLEWCYHYYDNGRLGDQLYLNDWPEKFRSVHVLKNLGANLAPWNAFQYKIETKQNQIFINGYSFIFYHFHSLKIYSKSKFLPCSNSYRIPTVAKKLIYRPYLEKLKESMKIVKAVDGGFNFGFSPRPPFLQKIKHIIKKLFYNYGLFK